MDLQELYILESSRNMRRAHAKVFIFTHLHSVPTYQHLYKFTILAPFWL